QDPAYLREDVRRTFGEFRRQIAKRHSDRQWQKHRSRKRFYEERLRSLCVATNDNVQHGESNRDDDYGEKRNRGEQAESERRFTSGFKSLLWKHRRYRRDRKSNEDDPDQRTQCKSLDGQNGEDRHNHKYRDQRHDELSWTTEQMRDVAEAGAHPQTENSYEDADLESQYKYCFDIHRFLSCSRFAPGYRGETDLIVMSSTDPRWSEMRPHIPD